MFEFGKRSYLMGILNITPDSFSDGAQFLNPDKALEQALKMEKEGADIIDIGGESTRPGAKELTKEKELARIIPVIKKIKSKIKIPISVDTYKGEVAKEVLNLGIDLINDIWGLQYDNKMAEIIANYKVPIVIMHNSRGQELKNDIIQEIKVFFNKSLTIAKEAGIKEDKIILDPGIGFGKTHEQNIEIMARLIELKELGYPLLLGTSRKSMLGNILNLPTNERVEGTIATTVIGIRQGVDIFRVHDIKENLRAARVADSILRK